MKRKYGVLIGLAICIMLGQGAALADSFSSRAAWIAALAGEPYYDVDFGAAPNSLTVGDTLAANAPIFLPPTWDATLSFDMALSVQDGTGVWNQYGANPPLVLATGAQSLVGTFSNGNEGIRAGGFEVLVDAASTLTITLTYLNQTTYVLTSNDDSRNRSILWLALAKKWSESCEFRDCQHLRRNYGRQFRPSRGAHADLVVRFGLTHSRRMGESAFRFLRGRCPSTGTTPIILDPPEWRERFAVRVPSARSVASLQVTPPYLSTSIAYRIGFFTPDVNEWALCSASIIISGREF